MKWKASFFAFRKKTFNVVCSLFESRYVVVKQMFNLKQMWKNRIRIWYYTFFCFKIMRWKLHFGSTLYTICGVSLILFVFYITAYEVSSIHCDHKIECKHYCHSTTEFKKFRCVKNICRCGKKNMSSFWIIQQQSSVSLSYWKLI